MTSILVFGFEGTSKTKKFMPKWYKFFVFCIKQILQDDKKSAILLKYSSIAQWQSTRLLTELLQVRALLGELEYMSTHIWPVGQAVKTSPFHGGNRGSIPLRVTTILNCIRRDSQAVRPRSATPLSTGSNPVHASKPLEYILRVFVYLQKMCIFCV